MQKIEKVILAEVNLDSGIACVEVEGETQMAVLDLVPSMLEALKKIGFQAEPHFG